MVSNLNSVWECLLHGPYYICGGAGHATLISLCGCGPGSNTPQILTMLMSISSQLLTAVIVFLPERDVRMEAHVSTPFLLVLVPPVHVHVASMGRSVRFLSPSAVTMDHLLRVQSV